MCSHCAATHIEGAPPAAFLPTDSAASGRESFSDMVTPARTYGAQ
jgi:hypothetical protein